MPKLEAADAENQPGWRQRAVSRSLSAARSRAEQRVQRFMDAALELIEAKGTTEFTIQEVVDRSKQSLRGFYQYFDGKDELLFALLEETIVEAADDLHRTVEAESDPIERLRVFTIRLHEWCEPVGGGSRKRGAYNRLPISEFSWQLAIKHPERVGSVMTPISKMLLELIEAAAQTDEIDVKDIRHTAVLVQQTVMYSWLMNRLVKSPRMQVSAEETWQFCLGGLRGDA
jgi:AcrR family transcriptional regulator